MDAFYSGIRSLLGLLGATSVTLALDHGGSRVEFSSRPGGCVGGAVRYELTADPVTLYACHCTVWQTATGDAGRHFVASAGGSHLDAQRAIHFIRSKALSPKDLAVWFIAIRAALARFGG